MADKRKSSIKGLGHDVINALVQKVGKKKKERESKRWLVKGVKWHRDRHD